MPSPPGEEGQDFDTRLPKMLHSPEYSDPYALIGTCNEERREAPEWNVDDLADKPYLAHVKLLSQSWRPLQQLADWLQIGTAPSQWKYLKQAKYQIEREERLKRTNLTIIEYHPGQDPTAKLVTTALDLKEILSNLEHEPNEIPPTRLFIVEDLSREVIELLGSAFDVDPLFFREHIEDYVWHNTRDPWAMPPSLMSSIKRRSWFRVRNARLRYYADSDSFMTAKLEANYWNVLRRPDDDNNHWQYRDADNAVVSITRTKSTIWIGADKNRTGGTVCIVLLDPTTKEGKPLWYDRASWLPTLSMKEPNMPELSKLSKSWYKDIVQMTLMYPWFEPHGDHDTVDPRVFALPTIYTISAEWLIVCDYVKARLSQIEWELELPKVFRAGSRIEDSSRRLFTWRRQIPIFREMITETLDQAIPVAVHLTSGVMNDFDETRLEFDRILRIVDDLQVRVERLTAEINAAASLEDARRSGQENHSLARLTWLASIFIPLTFVTGLFSMNEDIAALATTYKWFFATGIPFTVILAALGVILKSSWWNEKQDKNARRREARKRNKRSDPTLEYLERRKSAKR
ncbi:hypothetical protein C7974DRAFT_413610 [Boeremia exigua]|uniref:uncharacterized protein n=1 Tax=Boeremia exigua TaxID=749465 RepID=UPI001E8DABB5|nr:uncharacterized protein C7974DRAFT_413610 [Boeremia exigua]KAH6629857.1 hypothetical protein C7974DRAFT_413610 [Boeremia exigua]